MRIAEVAVPVPLAKSFHYSVPEGMRLEAGARVFDGEPERPLKALEAALDAGPALTPEMLDCARFMARRFGAPIGECVKAMVPTALKALDEPAVFAPAPQKPASAAFELTPGQAGAVARLTALLDAKKAATVLLFGVPASGKTEVYLRLIRRAIAEGGQAMFLLPEISLTRPFFDEFAASLGVPVCLWHSLQTPREKRLAWLGVRRGEVKVVVGARSACLLPFKDLRLAVLDEEQDESFKQDGQSPCYHARDVALERARAFGALAVLGSATPSIEAWDQVRRGKAELVAMPERVSAVPRAPVRMLAPARFGDALSDELVELMQLRLARKEQVILMVNRRGFATLTMCGKCRWIDRCQDCGVAKISHDAAESDQPELGQARWVQVCHHCGKTWPPPDKCGACGDPSVRASGIGTQRVAAEVKRRLPGAKVLRMDRDTVSKERKLEDRVYDQFRARKADVLVGTKLVAKSFHFPEVTLVGVVDADTMLHMPDFRSSERTMQLLAQVAGRAGRAEKPGEVVLQTLSPDHPAVAGAANGDYAAWADAELASRQELGYPPSAALVRAVISAKDDEKAQAAAEAFAEALKLVPGCDVIGPAPALLKEVRGRFRHQVLVKLAADRVEACLIAARAHKLPSVARLSLDSDPYDFL